MTIIFLAASASSVAAAANSVVVPAKKLDFWSAVAVVDSEGSGGSMALPYYSSIHPDPNRSSPVYQEAPPLSNNQSPVSLGIPDSQSYFYLVNICIIMILGAFIGL